MSIIIYGPKACGKTRNAEKLRQHFKMDKVVDTDAAPSPYPYPYPYPVSMKQMAEFKAGKTLFLTNIDPDINTYDQESRLIISFYEAMEQIKNATQD